MKKMLGFVLAVLFLLNGCVMVKAFEREKLADPLITPTNQFAKQKLDEKFFSTREGSIGGARGIGGGCGCAK
ncbi:MAG: DUF4266 domain-containing protein [Calditrichota bacterium]